MGTDKNYKIYNTILFVLSALLIIIVMPKSAKFPYEFKKGTPWLHQDLVAPLDFPIYKTKEELSGELDSLSKASEPYFKYDNYIFVDHVKLFRKKFESRWSDYIRQKFGITDMANLKNNNEAKRLNNLKNDYLNFSTGILEEIYNKGIIALPKSINADSLRDLQVYVIKNGISESFSINDYFNIKTAYEFVDISISNHHTPLSDNSYLDHTFINDLKIKDYIFPNLVYDDETTQKVKKNLVDNISLSRGMVNNGEKIISKGEVIDNCKLKILNSFKTEYETNISGTNNFYLIIIAQFVLVFFLLFSVFQFLYNFRNDILHDSTKTSFILLLIVLMVSVVGLSIKYTSINLYIIPLSILAIIIRAFYDTRLALFIHIITILTISFFVPNSFEFALMQILAGSTAVFSLANVNKRGQLFLSAIWIILTYALVFTSISLIQEGDISKISYKTYAWFGLNGLLVLTAYPLIYIFEKSFGFLSDVSLMELTDTNHPLMRKLAEKAPGTFQHSLQVSNLVEEVMVAIGGNSLLARTGALYHDIGKIENPHLFIENQGMGKNPHDDLEFDKSAELIIGHVIAGVKIAEEYNLPEQITDFIRTHHGTTKVQYFYRSFVKKYPQREVEIKKFTYPGPKPSTKEHAVVMLCDSVEAASRSLKLYSEESIKSLIDSIFSGVINEKQLENSAITFKDIVIIKEILLKQLLNIYHTRIEYPQQEKHALMPPEIA